MTATSPIAFVNAILLAYKKYGVDPDEMLKHAQIQPELLGERNGRITARQLEIFTEGAMRQLNDETLGWFARKLPWGTYGMLCRASLSSPNLGVALRRWFRHHLLITEDIEMTLIVSSDRVATVSVLENQDFGDMRELCLLSYLRFVHGYACWAIDSRMPLLQTSMPFDRPLHGDIYPLLFAGPVQFNAPRACFSFDAKYLTLAHQRDENALRVMLQRPLPLSILPYRRDRLLVQRVRKLMSDTTIDSDDADAVARLLHVSSRTMYRQLREEGTSLQNIKDEVRRERAIKLLCSTNKPIKQIALSVGFSSDKSFTRAFRQWTGDTPGDYRQKAALRM
ncbi:AraC family transcriptional regulator [Noviherbaspirillum sedimenti]|uniref:AraC family transcriptional regulator n=1 Tax=Noviherbaspirillum sedimenti TaxID=2320865 RepID=A0A3A3FX01_9BURK|nr:AraC family transcriptional regulator [Noviherbaspirillum sedimenti]RJG00677.1 AraC family transcriptional regulator [Noviherbaspirillum sedimenti]